MWRSLQFVIAVHFEVALGKTGDCRVSQPKSSQASGRRQPSQSQRGAGRVGAAAGSGPQGGSGGPSDDVLRDIHRRMVRIRVFETEAGRMGEAGKIPGALHLYVGEEAVAAGVMTHLSDDDWITSTHRGHGHLIAKGGEFNRMFAELFGRTTGYCRGKGGSMHISNMDLGMLGANGIVGAGPPIAVGAAFSTRFRKTDRVAVSFFGDGASNAGAFHEAANMAGLL